MTSSEEPESNRQTSMPSGEKPVVMSTWGVIRAHTRDAEFRNRVQNRVSKIAAICIFTILVLMMLTLATFCIVWGVQCLQLDCDPAPLIPVYLIAFGVAVLASIPNNFVWLFTPEGENKRLFNFYAAYRFATWVAEFAILIFGSVVVYSTPLDVLEQNSEKCRCLIVGFAIVTVTWVALCFSLCLSCLITCCVLCAAAKEIKSQRNPEEGKEPQ